MKYIFNTKGADKGILYENSGADPGQKKGVAYEYCIIYLISLKIVHVLKMILNKQ